MFQNFTLTATHVNVIYYTVSFSLFHIYSFHVEKKKKKIKIRITTNWVNLIIYIFNEDFTNCITLL